MEEERKEDIKMPLPKSNIVPRSIVPDGGWGWVVVFASFMCNLTVGKTNTQERSGSNSKLKMSRPCSTPFSSDVESVRNFFNGIKFSFPCLFCFKVKLSLTLNDI